MVKNGATVHVQRSEANPWEVETTLRSRLGRPIEVQANNLEALVTQLMAAGQLAEVGDGVFGWAGEVETQERVTPAPAPPPRPRSDRRPALEPSPRMSRDEHERWHPRLPCPRCGRIGWVDIRSHGSHLVHDDGGPDCRLHEPDD